MKPLQIHPVSALVGVALLGLVLLATGAVQVTNIDDAGLHAPFPPGGGGVPLIIDNPIQVLGIPTPHQMARVVEGQPFTVPTGKLFVVTGIATTHPSSEEAVVSFDGQAVIALAQLRLTGQAGSTGAGPSVTQVPPGLVAGPGRVVTVTSDNWPISAGVVLGYLADA